MQMIAFLTDQLSIRKILDHLGLVPARNVLNPGELSASDSTVMHGTCWCFVTRP